LRNLAELFDSRVKARSLAYLFTAGAGLGLLTLVLPHEEGVQDLQLWILAAIAIAVAALIYAQADRMAEWQLHLVLGAGTVILSFANYYTGSSALYPLLYTWAALYAFYFFDLRAALAHVAFIGAGYAVVLAIQDPVSPAIRWLLAVGTPLIAGLLISRMLERLRTAAVETEERESLLKQSEARTRLVLDSAPDAFVTLDRDGIIRTWNAAAERMFGWAGDEAIGKPMRALVVPPELRDRHDERRRALLDGDEPHVTQIFETEFERRDGSRFPAEAKVSKVTARGELFAAGFVRDVTDRLRREAEREALLREQAARAEAERVAEMVSGMQLLVDAALAHRTLGDIMSDLVTRVRGVLDADAAAIYLAEEGERLILSAASGGAPWREPTPPLAFGEGFAGRVASAREPLLAQDPEPDELPYPGLRELAVESLIGVPLLAEGGVTGVLVVGASAPRHFTADDLNLLRLAADRVALAIDHARVYEREHRIAETLQRSLLPDRLPQIPGLSVAARYLPAASEAEVGGDWYDVLPIPGGGVGLVMGDVAGKGLAAASMVGRLRSALRAYALEGHPPARVLERLNRLLWTEADDSQMATLLYVVIDPAEGRVRWVNGGHLPPLLLVDDRPPQFLEGGSSVPLGVLPFPDFEEVEVAVEPGAAVVLYTDGLVERPGEHIDSGLDRLAALVREGPADPQGICDHLLSELVPDGGPTDDVAILTLRTIPMEDRFRVEFPAAPESLSSMRALLRRWLRHAEGTRSEIAEVLTAAGEAATNAIEHAGGAGGRPFELSGQLEGREIEIVVRDFGSWRPPREGDHGRGLSLMGALMDDVEVTPAPNGTTVRLSRRLNSPAADGHGGLG
jgi:PAS domain S-box-containing protein